MDESENGGHRGGRMSLDPRRTPAPPLVLVLLWAVCALAASAAGCAGPPSPPASTEAVTTSADATTVTSTAATLASAPALTSRATTTLTLDSTLTSPSGKRIQQGQTPVAPSTPRSWALATGALLAEANDMRPDLLGGYEYAPEMVADQKHALAYWWGINSRRDLLRALSDLAAWGHRGDFESLAAYVAYLDDQGMQEFMDEIAGDEEARNQVRLVVQNHDRLGLKSILGWDYSRFVNLCRLGYYIGYLSEEEAWKLIMPVAGALQQTFESREDLGENYLIGREFWSLEETRRSGRLYRTLHQELLDDPQSPWNTNTWGMDLATGLQSN